MRFLTNKNLVLERENKDIKNIIYFEQSKKIPSIYTLKEKDINISIDITTKLIEIDKNRVKVIYMVNESNNEYEYFIEYRSQVERRN